MDSPGDSIVICERIYREHAPAVLGYALRRVQRSDDAADVLSEVMLIAWRRLEDVPPEEEVRPWLYGVARNVISNQARSSIRRERLGRRLREQIAELHIDPPLSESIDGHGGPVREALLELSEADREILLLSSWEDLEPKEIAVVLDIAPTAARTRLRRARQRLRDQLETPAAVGGTPTTIRQTKEQL